MSGWPPSYVYSVVESEVLKLRNNQLPNPPDTIFGNARLELLSFILTDHLRADVKIAASWQLAGGFILALETQNV